MLRILNNPIDVVLIVMEHKYPEFAERIDKIAISILENNMSYQIFLNNDDNFSIFINPRNKDGSTADIEEISERLARALSNIVSGEDRNGTEYQRVYEELEEGYEEYLENLQEAIIAREDLMNDDLGIAS